MNKRVYLIAFMTLVVAAFAQAQERGPRYNEYWQSYSNIERQYPAGYPHSDVLEPGYAVTETVVITEPARACGSGYPAPGVWNERNNSMANSTYSHWGQHKDGYSCERFLTKSCEPAAACAQPAIAKSVTYVPGNASDMYMANAAVIDDLKSMYCLPSHIIYRMKSRNDAAYRRAQTGGAPNMPGASLEHATLSGLYQELVKLRATCVDGQIR